MEASTRGSTAHISAEFLGLCDCTVRHVRRGQTAPHADAYAGRQTALCPVKGNALKKLIWRRGCHGEVPTGGFDGAPFPWESGRVARNGAKANKGSAMAPTGPSHEGNWAGAKKHGWGTWLHVRPATVWQERGRCGGFVVRGTRIALTPIPRISPALSPSCTLQCPRPRAINTSIEGGVYNRGTLTGPSQPLLCVEGQTKSKSDTVPRGSWARTTG